MGHLLPEAHGTARHEYKPVTERVLAYLIAGAIFEQGTDQIQSAFKFAMQNHNLNVTMRRFELQAYVDVINTADAFKLSRLSK